MDTAPGHGASWGSTMATFPQTLSKNGVTTNLLTGIRTYADGSTERLTGGALDMARRAGGWTDSGLAGHIQSGQPGDFSGDSTYYAAGTYPGTATGLKPSSNGTPAAKTPATARPATQTPATARPGASFGGGMPSSSGVANISGYTAGMNPYLQQMGDVLTQQMTGNFRNNVLPGVASGAMASGGFGGSRQGVIEANAMNDLNQQIGGALTNLYGQGYGQALNYDLGMRNTANSYDLGMRNAANSYDLGLRNAANSYDLGLRNNQLGYGNLGLGYANLDRNINNDNWANNMQGAQFGLNVWDRTMANNQTGINAGTNIQNTPMNYWNQFSQGANSIGQGYSTQTSSGSTQGNPMLGALGGAQLGSQFSNWWSGGGNGGGNSGGGMTAAPSGNYNIGSYDYSLGSGGGGLGLKF